MAESAPRIGFIGFGEVAYGLAQGFNEVGLSQAAYVNGKRHHPPYDESFRKKAGSAGVELVATMSELVGKSDVIFSCVIGPANLEVAREAARFVRPGVVFVDLNNSPPQAKESAAEAINQRGGSYVDAALVGPARTKKHKAPFWASGDGAAKLKALMEPHGMNITIVPGKAGTAAMLKTIRQVFQKGLQALMWETLIAAYKAGIDPKSVDLMTLHSGSQKLNFVIPDEQVCHAGFHAERKAAELQGSVDVLRQLGVEPLVTEGAARRLAKLASFDLKSHFDAVPSDYQAMLKAMEQSGKGVG